MNFIELPVDLINNSCVLSKELRRYTSPLLLIPDDHSYRDCIRAFLIHTITVKDDWRIFCGR